MEVVRSLDSGALGQGRMLCGPGSSRRSESAWLDSVFGSATYNLEVTEWMSQAAAPRLNPAFYVLPCVVGVESCLFVHLWGCLRVGWSHAAERAFPFSSADPNPSSFVKSPISRDLLRTCHVPGIILDLSDAEKHTI